MSDLYTQPEGEYPRTVSVDTDGMMVSRKHVTRHKTGDVYLTWSFDFTDCSQSQILELASRAVLIGTRPEFKKVPAAIIDEWDGRTFNVADFMSRERTAKSSPDKVKTMFAGLSDDEKADLLKDLKNI